MSETIKRQLNNLSDEQRTLVDLWLRIGHANDTSEQSNGHPHAEARVAPPSYGQERMWMLDQGDQGKAVFTLPMAIHLTGPLDLAALKRSVEAIIARHATLRTTFEQRDGRLVQVIAPQPSLRLVVVDLRALPEDQRDPLAHQIAYEQVERPFDLTKDLLVRTTALRFGAHEHRLIVTMHHLASDGWSLRVFFSELAEIYNAISTGRAAQLPDLPIQYADFSVEQRQVLSEEALRERLEPWQRRLANLPRSFGPPPPLYDAPAARYPFQLSPQLSDALRAASQREGAFPFIMLLTALKLVLARYLQSDDIVVGISSANRDQAEVKNLIGFFANMLVVRTDLSGQPGFEEAQRRVRDGFLEAYDNRDLPIERMLDAIDHTHIEVVFNYVPNMSEPSDAAKIEDLEVKLVDVRLRGIYQFANLMLIMFDRPEGMHGSLSYKTDLFDADTIWQLADSYIEMLEQMVGA